VPQTISYLDKQSKETLRKAEKFLNYQIVMRIDSSSSNTFDYVAFHYFSRQKKISQSLQRLKCGSNFKSHIHRGKLPFWNVVRNPNSL